MYCQQEDEMLSLQQKANKGAVEGGIPTYSEGLWNEYCTALPANARLLGTYLRLLGHPC